MEIPREETGNLSLWVSVSETAAVLGIGRKMVYQLLEYGELKAVREKGRVRIEKRSIDLYLKSGRRI